MSNGEDADDPVPEPSFFLKKKTILFLIFNISRGERLHFTNGETESWQCYFKSNTQYFKEPQQA